LEVSLGRAERDSAEALTLLDTLQSTAPVGFLFVDRDFRYVRVNEAAAAIGGVSVAEHLGRTVAEVVPDLWPRIGPIYRRVVDRGEATINLEVIGETRAEPGRSKTWLVSFYPVRIDAAIIGVGVVLVDITDRKEAEQAQSALTHAAVAAIAATVEARDPYTAGHQRRVADIAVAIAAEMGLDAYDIEGIRLAAEIHDIGKLVVPAEILTRPGRLRPAEYELIKGHSRAGYEIVEGIAFPWPVAKMILQHHERLDGSGYPDGLRGAEILIGARIIAVADVVEAMATQRPYRTARGVDAALHEIETNRGGLYDSVVVDASLRLSRQGRLSLAPIQPASHGEEERPLTAIGA
jgi:PAS domain S-box-containing protein/putative nucleotidyltransferase with HDIG domain